VAQDMAGMAGPTPRHWPGLPRPATPRSTSVAGTGPPADRPPPDSGRDEPIVSGSCTNPRHGLTTKTVASSSARLLLSPMYTTCQS
jgi:hypothetical protein